MNTEVGDKVLVIVRAKTAGILLCSVADKNPERQFNSWASCEKDSYGKAVLDVYEMEITKHSRGVFGKYLDEIGKEEIYNF